MPDQITVSEFIAETTEDYNSPTTSSFTTRLQNCRNTVTLLEEVNHTHTAPLPFFFPPFIFFFFSSLRKSMRTGQYHPPKSTGARGIGMHVIWSFNCGTLLLR